MGRCRVSLRNIRLLMFRERIADLLDEIAVRQISGRNEMGAQIQRTRTKDDLFYQVFNACPIGIALEDLEGRPLFANLALCSMLGFSQEEMLSKQCVDFSPREDAEKDWLLFQRLREGSIDHYQLDKRYTRRDGSLMWGRLSVSLMNHRESPLVIAMVEDVTEKKASQETLELAAEHVAAVIRCSRDFRFVWVSRGYADLIEQPVDKIVGRPIVDVLGKEEFEAMRPHFERVFRGERISYEVEMECRSVGRRWISASHFPTHDADGTVSGLVAVIVDMTQRKRSEEALRRSEGYLSQAERLAHTGSWAWDARTRETFWSREMFRILGYDPDKTKPSLPNFLARVHPDDRARAERRVEDEASGLDTVFDYRILLPDGTMKHLQAIAHPIKNGSGEIAEVVGTTVDITQRKLAEEALSTVSQKLIEAQEQERSRIARELHDDINQRLALLGVTLQRMQQDLPSSEVQLVGRMREAWQAVTDLANDVQNLSHQLHSPKLELLGLAAAAASFCRELSDREGVEIEFQSENVPKELTPEVSLPLFRVLQEALQNSIKHSRSRSIQVSLRGAASEVELDVCDSGVGFQLEEAIKGRGLGLTSMIERLKMAQGRLSIDSDPQRGTTLQARVPLIARTKAAATKFDLSHVPETRVADPL
jgi:PAS domain S-box-containing protein